MRRERLIWPAKNSNIVISIICRYKKPRRSGVFYNLFSIKRERSRCAAASVCTGDAVRLSFNFDFFTVNNDGQNFAVDSALACMFMTLS